MGETTAAAEEQKTPSEPPNRTELGETLCAHFGADARGHPVVADDFDLSDHANIQLALDALLAEPHRSAELLGFVTTHYESVGLSHLVAPPPRRGDPPTPGPVRYIRSEVPGRDAISAVERGLYLIREGESRLAVLILGPAEWGYPRQIVVEVMATDADKAQEFLASLRNKMRERNVYRGRVVSLEMSRNESLKVHFHELPSVERDRIILPSGLLDRIERQTIRFAAHRDRLRAMGRHIKRGLLLHGAPGTGKTLTAMYLANQMHDRTTFLVTGRGLGLIERTCRMARLLAPATVIVEDIDLVAEERTRQAGCSTSVLFELLNQMDGLADDADVLFLLTTNRPDILEPALASRPGRVDQAIELPLPDAEGRRRLFDLYSEGMAIELQNRDQLIEQLEGVSGAFIRELLRKAALLAVDEHPDSPLVADQHVRDAVHELIRDGGDLTRSLLGATKYVPSGTAGAGSSLE